MVSTSSSLLLILCLSSVACGDDAAPGADVSFDSDFVDPGLSEIMTTTGSGEPAAGFDACEITTAQHVTGRASHTPNCSALPYAEATPASGDHYGTWADFRRYEAPVPQGFVVHALEHGAIAIQYDCEDCTELLAAIDTLIEEHGVDPACEPRGVDSRFLVAPNPDIDDALVVLTAWEHVYKATCIDVESMRAFIDAHYGQGPEDLCARGLDGESRGGWCG